MTIGSSLHVFLRGKKTPSILQIWIRLFPPEAKVVTSWQLAAFVANMPLQRAFACPLGTHPA